MKTTWKTAPAGALLFGLLVVAGCGGPGAETPAAAPTTTADPGPTVPPAAPDRFLPGARSGQHPPTITGFTAPPNVVCASGGTATVPVSYQTSGAVTVTFTVGVDQVKGYPPLSGSYDVPVPCDGNAHTIVLFAVAADMSTNTDSKAVLTGT